MSVGLSGEDTATLGIAALRGIQVAQEEQPDLQFGETVFSLQLDTQDTACGTEGGAATAEYFTADARVAGVLGPVCTAACLAAAPIYDEAGGLGDIPLFGSSAWLSPAVPERVGAAANRNVYLASNLPHQETEEQRARQAAFAARYEERFGEAPVSHVHDNAYDTYLMIRAAIEQVGTLDDEGNLRIDRAALAAALRSYGPVAGLSGPLACDGSGECASTPIGIWQIQDGAFALIEEMVDPSMAEQ